jgi:pyruvate ferredoxin oxidoreductase alpha subunit
VAVSPAQNVSSTRSPDPHAVLLTGAQAVAEAMRQIDPDVMAVYPITPQTPIIESFSQFVADGRVHTELLLMESEHSALSATLGSALAGARAVTATASQGLAYMIEILYIAAGLRAPFVMAVGMRALSAPINIHGDHSDVMLARDTGAVIVVAESAEEAYDLFIVGTRLSEDPDVMLPVLVSQDGFTTTHSAEPVHVFEDAVVRGFVGRFQVPYPLLDTCRPTTQGAFAMPDSYFGQKIRVNRATVAAEERLVAISREWASLSGRDVSPVEGYRVEDAAVVLIAMGSAVGTMKDAVDRLRADGIPAGVLKVRLFRPFPAEEVLAALRPGQELLVFDRALSPGSQPVLYSEVASRLRKQPVRSLVFGLGGRDLTVDAVVDLVRTRGRLPAQQSVFVGVDEDEEEEQA